MEMRLTIAFSKQEIHPPGPSGLTVEMRDEGAPTQWSEEAQDLADRLATKILGSGCMVRTVGLAREYLPKNGGEWQEVKTPVTYRG
jgi:hypothetical protein